MDVRLCEDVKFSPSLLKSASDSNSGSMNNFQQPLMSMVKTISAHYEQLQALEFKIQEILQTQQECLKITSVENRRFKEVHSTFDFNVMFMQVSTYTKKVVSIHNDMVIIQNKMDRLKHRVKILKEYQDVKMREIQETKALHEERERLLIAKPVWETNQLHICDQT